MIKNVENRKSWDKIRPQKIQHCLAWTNKRMNPIIDTQWSERSLCEPKSFLNCGLWPQTPFQSPYFYNGVFAPGPLMIAVFPYWELRPRTPSQSPYLPTRGFVPRPPPDHHIFLMGALLSKPHSLNKRTWKQYTLLVAYHFYLRGGTSGNTC